MLRSPEWRFQMMIMDDQSDRLLCGPINVSQAEITFDYIRLRSPINNPILRPRNSGKLSARFMIGSDALAELLGQENSTEFYRTKIKLGYELANNPNSHNIFQSCVLINYSWNSEILYSGFYFVEMTWQFQSKITALELPEELDEPVIQTNTIWERVGIVPTRTSDPLPDELAADWRILGF